MTIGVLFVCTANICRSPMAEGAFRTMARRAGLDSVFTVDSAGTFVGHLGEPPALRAIIAASRRGYDIAGLRARQVVAADIARLTRPPGRRTSPIHMAAPSEIMSGR